ncbi:MAG: Smr/MutS family protein [Oceanicaulis sp.]
MSRRPPSRALSAEERALWRKIARGVTPLDPNRLRALDDPAPPKTDPAARPVPAPGPLKAGAARRDPEPVRAPADQSHDRKLRRGRIEIEARIDLHGLTGARARRDLLAFLHRARANGLRRVLVITGKGAGARALDRRKFEPWDSDAPPLPGVIRRSFAKWMTEPDFAEVASGYAEAHRRHGGAGAFYVMIRS